MIVFLLGVLDIQLLISYFTIAYITEYIPPFNNILLLRNKSENY